MGNAPPMIIQVIVEMHCVLWRSRFGLAQNLPSETPDIPNCPRESRHFDTKFVLPYASKLTFYQNSSELFLIVDTHTAPCL